MTDWATEAEFISIAIELLDDGLSIERLKDLIDEAKLQWDKDNPEG